tara:strand:- start:54 stop:518 length:465 start_codon:yes stop_codon:yes gene_type:complete
MKITKEELANIIKEEVEEALIEQEKVPKERPDLPKNWRELDVDDPKRVAFRKWYTTHGPGSKRKKPAPAAKPAENERSGRNYPVPERFGEADRIDDDILENLGNQVAKRLEKIYAGKLKFKFGPKIYIKKVNAGGGAQAYAVDISIILSASKKQ